MDNEPQETVLDETQADDKLLLDQAENLLHNALVYLRAVNQGDLRSREMSLAITNLEQGQHWLNHNT